MVVKGDIMSNCVDVVGVMVLVKVLYHLEKVSPFNRAGLSIGWPSLLEIT